MGDTGEGEAVDEAADAATAEAEGENEAGGRRSPVRRVALVAGTIAGVVLIGGVALAARGGDPSPPSEASAQAEPSERSTSTTTEPVETATTTLAPTTTAPLALPVTEPGPTTAPPRTAPPATQAPPPPPPRAATCLLPWPRSSGPLPTVVAGPGEFVAFGPPTASCVDVADGCLVSVTLGWSDGYSEVGSLVLAEPGSYTVNGDRGTSWTFTVDGDRVCTSDGGHYSNVWRPGT